MSIALMSSSYSTIFHGSHCMKKYIITVFADGYFIWIIWMYNTRVENKLFWIFFIQLEYRLQIIYNHMVGQAGSVAFYSILLITNYFFTSRWLLKNLRFLSCFQIFCTIINTIHLSHPFLITYFTFSCFSYSHQFYFILKTFLLHFQQ